jgi:VanZ family protein
MRPVYPGWRASFFSALKPIGAKNGALHKIVMDWPLFRRCAGYCDSMMTRSLLKGAAWLVLAFILFSTVSPIGLRPHTLMTADTDRAGAYALAGLVFVLAYPRHWKAIGLLLVIAAIGFELLQELSPSRHARLHDALIKAGGSMLGVAAAYTVNQMRARRTAAMHVAGEGQLQR